MENTSKTSTKKASPDTVLVSVEFYFKGDKYSPSMEINLDEFFEVSRNLDAVYSQLASKNAIGAYSYEYEVMEANSLLFSEAQGLAAGYVADGELDVEGYLLARAEAKMNRVITELAESQLSSPELAANTEVKTAEQLREKILKESIENDSPTQVALSYLKNEVKKLF